MNTMNQMSETVSNAKDALTQDVRALMDATANMAEAKITEARKRLADAFDSGGRIFDRVEEKAVEGARCTDKAVREHPYPAIAIALGAGALIGFLAAQR